MHPANRRLWLVANATSGSNDEKALVALKEAFAVAGFAIERVIAFPDEALPAASGLDSSGIELVAVFAGDGTVNALVSALGGWGGSVLVLPGGTMNLLFHRLHGQRQANEVVKLVAEGKACRLRPKVISCDHGTALADLLAGPGTRWFEVREAMREADLVAIAGSIPKAIGETLAKPGIACREPVLGVQDGYPLVMLTPTHGGILVSGFAAETPAEFLREGWAVLRRRFREGPHDELGLAESVTLEDTAGEAFSILLDGEREQSGPRQHFRLVPCEVDLLATQADGR